MYRRYSESIALVTGSTERVPATQTVESDLEIAEDALTEARREIDAALDGLRRFREGESRTESALALGEALNIARNPGASGTASSKIEKALAALTEVQILFRVGALPTDE